MTNYDCIRRFRHLKSLVDIFIRNPTYIKESDMSYYSGEFYCQYANGCNNKKCIGCIYYKQSMQKIKSDKKNKGK